MPIRVLVVDDSAFARKVLREVLSRDPRLEVVDIARDGLEALEKITELAPDVVTLDLVMPNLDGVGVLRMLPPERRPGVVVVSISDEHSELGLEALALGAFDVVHKPTALATERLYDLADELIEKVVAASTRGVVSLAAVSSPPIEVAPVAVPRARARRSELLVLGASTGGPQAIARILAQLPADFPVPVAVVLHLPGEYTGGFARRLDAGSKLKVVEARDDLALEPGLAVVARGGLHLKLTRGPSGLSARLDAHPALLPHRPSVDVLFQSAAEVCGARVVGVVLTGMGTDGVEGARAVRAAGGTILTESEDSCIVYGMPRAVVEAGLSQGSAPLETLVAEIMLRL